MNQDSITKTIELLGQLIQKPPLNQKLLSRPPFRYIHDIFSEVINSTGYFSGLYTGEEMMSENVKDKEAKVAYLNKMMKTLELIHGVEPPVDSYKIIAGLDADATNAFLQMLALTVINKMPFQNAVNKVLGKDIAIHAQKPNSSEVSERKNGVNQNEKVVVGAAKDSNSGQSDVAEPILRQNIDKKYSIKESNAESESLIDLKKDQDSVDTNSNPILNSGYTRPMTARAPPPKAKKQEVINYSPPVPSTAILKEHEKDTEDEFFGGDEFPFNDLKNDESELQKIEKGGLVSKLLEKKRDLEGDGESNSKSAKKAISPQEIEMVRQSIQMLCKCTQPLGKMLDYIQEDIDGMSKELLFWRKEAAKYEKKLREEKAQSNTMNEDKYIMLDKIIDEQMENIRKLKGDILKKDNEIANYLSNLSKPLKN